MCLRSREASKSWPVPHSSPSMLKYESRLARRSTVADGPQIRAQVDTQSVAHVGQMISDIVHSSSLRFPTAYADRIRSTSNALTKRTEQSYESGSTTIWTDSDIYTMASTASCPKSLAR